MHSSRMRIVRNRSCLLQGGVCLVRGCVCSGRGVLAPGGAWSGGVSAPRGGGVVSQHALRQTPLWTEWLTDRCKNITFATSLRTVMICVISRKITDCSTEMFQFQYKDSLTSLLPIWTFDSETSSQLPMPRRYKCMSFWTCVYLDF